MSFSAGRADRGDIKITFEPLRKGSGVQIELVTSVERLYGASVRAEIANALSSLDVSDCKIAAIDDGALPYVIQARVEAAVRLAQEAKDEG